MRKWLLILLLALTGVSCDWTLREESATDGSAEGEVTIHFTLPYPEVPATRSLAENMDLHNLYVAVFGSSGFFKEYKKAQLLSRLDDDYIDNVPIYDTDGETVVGTRPVSVPQYEFSVTLTLSEKARQIHFLGNGPEFMPSGSADQVLPGLLCEPGEGAFWQMIRVSKIAAEKNDDGTYKTGTDGAYVPDYDTKNAFREIALIRNWAKIELDASTDSNFTPISFAVVNKPSRGSIVPYSANTKFIEGYQNMSFKNLNEVLQYPGNLPVSVATSFDTTCPSEADFKKFDDITYTEDTFDGGRGVVARYREGNAVYLYERTVPSESISPTYVIIYGHYRNPEDLDNEGDYFYKVDLMEGQKYYPIFRNFKYRINIRKILAPGQATPELATTAAGSADVSSDIITQHLLDISDGTARLIVSPWIAQTFTKKYDGFKDLKVKFLPDMTSSAANDGSLIELQLIPEDGDVILDKRLVTEEIDEGWIPISITTSAPTDLIRTQTLRVIGHYPGWPAVDSGLYLYRDIQITVQNKQEMRVTCDPRVLQEKGTPVTVTVSIPDGLVQSMFPLVFTIEAEDMTLEPDISVTTDNNLPVTYGESISEHADFVGKQAYQFLRTLSWEEYRRLKTEQDSQNNTWRYFNCYFRANQDDNVTTIWVDNDQYFKKAHCDYQGYVVKRFNNFEFTSPIPLAEDAVVSVHFNLQRDPYMVSMGTFPEILVRAQGLTPDWDGWWPGEEVGTYLFTPTTDDITLPFHTTTDNGEVSVELSAEEYHTAKVTCGRFNENVIGSYYGSNLVSRLYGMVGGNDAGSSNSAYGFVNNVGGKNLIFGYFDDPEAPLPAITLKYVDSQGNETPLSNKSNPSGLSSNVAFPWKPTGPKSNSGDSRYHELTLQTIAAYKDIPINFVLSANGYVDFPIHAERFKGNSRIHTLKALTNDYLTGSNVSFQDPPYVFSGYDTKDYGYMQITIEPLDGAPTPIQRTSAPKGIVLGADSEGATQVGARYRVRFKCSDYGNYPHQKLFCTLMVFSANARWNGVTYKSFEPASMTPTFGMVYRYPGNGPNYWMWQVSDNSRDNESIEMVVGECPIIFNSFVVRTFSGSLY